MNFSFLIILTLLFTEVKATEPTITIQVKNGQGKEIYTVMPVAGRYFFASPGACLTHRNLLCGHC